MNIGGFRRSSSTDYSGHTAAVIFAQGCNWRCPYCHGVSLVATRHSCPLLKEEQIFAYLQRRKEKITAVVITGGEPTLQPDLAGFLSRLRQLDLRLKLDTNGSQPEVLRAILSHGLLDAIAMDVKAPLANYSQTVGTRTDLEAIRNSLWLVKNSGIEHEFRTTVVPGLHTVQELREIGFLVQGAKRYVLQEFLPHQTLRDDFRHRVAFTRKILEDLIPFFQSRVEMFAVRSADLAPTLPEPITELPLS